MGIQGISPILTSLLTPIQYVRGSQKTGQGLKNGHLLHKWQ